MISVVLNEETDQMETMLPVFCLYPERFDTVSCLDVVYDDRLEFFFKNQKQLIYHPQAVCTSSWQNSSIILHFFLSSVGVQIKT